MLGSSELKPASAGDFDKRELDLARRELELERRELEHLRKYQLGSSHKVETAPACSNATSLFTLSATNSSSPSVDQKLVSDLCVNENPFSKDMHNPFSSNSFANPYQLPFQQLGPAPNPFATLENRHKCGRPMYHPPAPAAMNDQSRVSELIDALSIMTNSINRSQTRTVRGDDLFYGDPIDYRRFIRYFETYTIRGVHDSATRLNLLSSSCAGEAKESIVNCIMCESPDVGYWKARHILEENFGQIGSIINAYVKKLTEGPPIKNNDSEGILKFTRDLYNCELTCGSRPESGLDSQHVVGKVFARLPKSLQEKFITSVSFQLENGHPITFSQLSQFMQKQSHVERSFLNQIVKSKDPNTTNFNFSKKSCNKPAIHSTQSSIAPSPVVESAFVKTNQFKEVDRKRKSCPMCVQAHPLWKCLKFQNATEKQKWNTVWKSGCCINCLGDHLVRHCQSLQRCKMCQDKHHTLLHHREHNLKASTSANNKNSGSDNGAGVDNPVKVLPNCVQIENHVNQVNSNDQLLVKSSSSQVTQDSKLNVRLKVVPVTVWSSCSDRCLNTYAFLDEGSNATLCTESLVKDLGLIGHKVQYSISTVCETKQQLGVKVSLRFCGINELAIFEAPDVLAVPHLPDLKGSIPSNADTKHFAHLHGLNFPDLGHKRVDILIGADVIKAHLPDQTRSGLDNEPIGIHTPLGWSIVGPTLAATGTVGPTSLVVNFVRVDNDTLHKQLMKMFRHDFQTDNGATGLSVEDKEALASMRSSIKLNDGHYTVSLPRKHSNVTLPNNRQVALRRISHLQKRFLKDFNFYKLYEAKMKEYVINGYARKVPDDNLQPGSKTWYLPHHATGNKFRIVFDCGASFKGTSLNDNLLQGPDLTGNLLGVFTRFREGPIAVIADIRAMFHQVKVSPEDRDSLRFLWWDNNDIASTPKEYQMLVHLFGATSSPSCCSFALRQVGIDNLANADPDVLSCLKRNFYVDDFLKSFHNEGDALRIIAQLTASLERGGFHLTKFSSSHPQILSVLPDSDLSSTMLDLNLDTAETKVLGIIWNPTLDKLEVKVKVKYKPLTRRGILSMISQLFDPIGFLQPFILPVKLLMQELCHLNLGWDVEIPLDKKVSWYNWLDTLCSLEKFCYPRCSRPHSSKVLKNSSLRKLCPFIAHGVLRVGGRIHKAYIPYEMKHPMILPPHHHVTKLIILSYHLRNGHSGVLHTLSDTRDRFWIINGNAAVRRVLHDCYKCRLLNAAPGKQVMSHLPEFRVSSGCPAFTCVGLDYAGPIFSKVGRSLAKRYLCVFTCMATRAVHLEIAHSLDTQSCLQALQRFIGRRGSPRDVYSDNGSNFVGAARELKEAISKWNQSLINKTLCQKGISWHFNPPAASHQGGVWERVIRSVRRILTALAGERVLTDECLSTFVTEVERILNDRPISAVSSDSRDLKALTPNSLLLGNINPVVPPNVFIKAEGYRNSWKLVHWLADEFWRRWLKSYLPQLQQHQKWLKPHRNLAPGDLVLVCDEQCRRGQWPKAIVEEVYPGDDGYVRVAKIKTASSAFKRDVRKLCLLEGAE